MLICEYTGVDGLCGRLLGRAVSRGHDDVRAWLCCCVVWGARRLQLPTAYTSTNTSNATSNSSSSSSSSSQQQSNGSSHSNGQSNGQANGQSNGQSNGFSGVHLEAAARQLAALCAEHSAELAQDTSVQFVLSYLQQLAARLVWERAAVAKEHSSMLNSDGRKSPRHVRLSSDLGAFAV
jgi:hypothetical protein